MTIDSSRPAAQDHWQPHALESLASEVVVQACVLLALLVGGTWLGLAAGLGITPWHLPCALAATVVLAVWRGRALGNVPLALVGAVGAFAVLAASIGLALLAYDVSYDGSAYHQVGVIALRDGWNPITQPHVVDWSNAAHPERQALADRIADRGLWTDHFPKSVWMLGALVSSTTGWLDASKWPRGFLAVVALLALYRGLALSGTGRPLAAVCALVAVVSQVTLAQMNTNYVDGPLAGMLAVLVGSVLAWLARHRGRDLFVALVMVGLAASTKSTGGVFAAPLLVAALALGLVAGWRPAAADAALLVAGVLFTAGVSWQTYAHNALSHGHPLYPAHTTNVMRGQMADRFLDRGRVEKFLYAHLQEPNLERDAERPAWVVPRPWHYRVSVAGVDLRMAAFGTHFVYALALALVTGLAAVVALLRKRSMRGGALALTLAFAWAVGSTLIHPEFWWARYVPQLWWVPLLAAALAARLQWRLVAALNLLPALAASALFALFWVQDLVQDRTRVRHQLAAMAASGSVAVSDDAQNAPLLYVLAQHLAERGATLVLRPPAACGPGKLGFVRVCDGPQPAPPR